MEKCLAGKKKYSKKKVWRIIFAIPFFAVINRCCCVLDGFVAILDMYAAVFMVFVAIFFDLAIIRQKLLNNYRKYKKGGRSSFFIINVLPLMQGLPFPQDQAYLQAYSLVCEEGD
ncbi:hypothetical protein NCCP28_29510 [Niallia sp. NCCP-28]|nr:hypothetical protein NCCP28_29510 [Niallia sp. NCCP-28]